LVGWLNVISCHVYIWFLSKSIFVGGGCIGGLIFSGIFVGHVCVCALLSTWVEPRLLGKVLGFCFFLVLVRFGLGWKGGVGLAVLISEGVFNPSTFCIDAFCSDFVI
jgi:hypothetical protein